MVQWPTWDVDYIHNEMKEHSLENRLSQQRLSQPHLESVAPSDVVKEDDVATTLGVGVPKEVDIGFGESGPHAFLFRSFHIHMIRGDDQKVPARVPKKMLWEEKSENHHYSKPH
jgi:hypothetical protein